MRAIARTSLLAAVLLLAGIACSSATRLEHVLSFTFSAVSTQAAVGETMQFNFEVTGPSLLGVFAEYGDGVVDSVSTVNATSAEGRFIHTYQTAGTFLVRATLEDRHAGSLTDSVSVQITP